MQTVNATLVSQSKDGKRAMVIVRGEADGKPFTATRHVIRASKNGSFVGANPDPRTVTSLEQANRGVLYAENRIRYLTGVLLELTDNSNVADKDKREKGLKRLGREMAEVQAMLVLAQEKMAKAEADYPLQVQFVLN